MELGRTQFAQRDFLNAKSSFEQAVALSSKSVDALRSLGLVDLELKEYQAAYQSWLKATKLNPKEEKSRYYLGRLFYEADLPNEAAVWLRQALILQPSDFSAMTYLGLSAEALGYEDTALALYRNAVEISTSSSKPFSWAYLSLGKLLSKRSESVEALNILRKGCELCPEPHELTAYGEALASQKQNDQAEHAFRRSIQMDPTISQTHYRLALLLTLTGRAPEARSEMILFQNAKNNESKVPRITALRKQ